MSYDSQCIQTASSIFGIPIDTLSDMWLHGTDVTTGAMVQLGVNSILHAKTLFIHDGIVRQYFVDNEGQENTMRIIQGPALYSPAMYESIEDDETKILSQSLTNIKGRVWDIEFMLNLSRHNPLFFNLANKGLLDDIKVKALKDARRQDCSALERYQLFLSEFPGAVNRIPLKHIASYLNLTPETLSRIRKKLSTK